MFIVWGKKIVYRKVGYVADFCAICRTVQSFELKRVGSAGHVYYISSGEGELVGYERTCQTCETAFEANPHTYASVAKKLVSLSELTTQTFPNIDQVLRDRLELEAKVKNAPSSLSPEERVVLIRNPFLLLSPKVEKRFASTHLDKEIGFSIIAAIALLIGGPALSHAVAPDAGEEMVLLFIVLGVSLVAWQVAMSSRRFMKRQVVPVLAEALRPLRPTEHELKSVLSELKQLRHKIGAKLKLVDLQDQMKQTGDFA